MKKFLICLLMISALFTVAAQADQSSSQEYIVEKFDTLWGISSVHLEDPFLWPKLWNVNPHIKNPDLIYPGTKILIPTREELMKMTAPVFHRVPAARKKHAVTPQTRNVWRFAPLQKKKYAVDKNLYMASGWIADTYPATGTITSISMGRNIAGKGDTVYVSGTDGAALSGRYFAIRDEKIVKHPVTGSMVGHLIKVLGVLDIKNNKQKTASAEVTVSFEDIAAGDGILTYRDIVPPNAEPAGYPEMNGYIIETYLTSSISGQGDIVFLDRGQNDGLGKGDVFAVLSDKPEDRKIGQIMVVSLQPKTSGAVVLKSTADIHPGARWGMLHN